MSRNTLIIILILVLIGYGATILYIGPAPPPVLKPEAKYTEPMGLSIRSLGEEISVPNETALIEKLEQFAEEDYQYFVATSVNYQKYWDTGAVITMKYQTPVNITWVITIEGLSPEIHHINVKQITAALSHDRESYSANWLLVYPDQKTPFQYPLEIPREQANELLDMIGVNPIPESS
ncbi:hypothetical protein O0S10_00450 [Methanocorpusculum sp. MG]|uniref:Uncharacterized protein n=1 Tax=Methanocorpusculum petauri TaxID=3002863 RepID=A0ABT4ID72_9EURY|nr:hypothetical protein [Methanocorpusculum petauri]MCZ0859693.1 hypothetical protein [Methanocorpusculum petauri]MDE2443469.1 hypothetical protein [Methanocorpusculum sp.]